MKSDALTPEVTKKLKELTTLYGRDNPILSYQPVISAATV
jgi:hypothetical protein